jgi:ATP-dependent Clp protease ATP-binding subunit ClpB
MDLNRLTEKAQDVIRGAQAQAQRHGHAQIDVEHLAAALLGQDGGVAPRIVDKAGGSAASIVQRLQRLSTACRACRDRVRPRARSTSRRA